MDSHLKASIAAVAMVVAGLLYFATCTASAAPYVLKFRNPGTVLAYTQLRTPWGVVAAPCAPGAECSVVIDIPSGRQTITAEASSGTLWSATSNALSVIVRPTAPECLALAACRFDFDGDGLVSGSDFSAFVAAFGSTWAP